MSNSSLISYRKISPNRTTPRNHTIDTITIHCYVGQASVESMAAWLCDPSSEASANYGIGSDGRIALFVEEKDRSWCSSSRSNDHRAITIECASDTTDPYAINSKVYNSLINLCADICKRNGIKELKWKADKSLIGHPDQQNMTVHRWFANKACPGDYIYNRLGQIAKEVNTKLGVTTEDPDIGAIRIGDTTIERIAQVVHGEAGVIGSEKALLAVAQCIKDMLETKQYGSTITEVMANNFYAYKTNASSTEAAKKAVYDVFVNGKRRFDKDMILQFRSFTNYSDGHGNMNEKCKALLKKYDYLGEDHKDLRWGHFYFGKKNSVSVKPDVPSKEFSVRVTTPNLNIRTGAGTNYAKTGHTTGIGVFTIVETKPGKGSVAGWGRLKSGMGWISLDYATRLS